MEIVLKRILKAVAVSGAFLLIIVPTIEAGFVPGSHKSFLTAIFQKVALPISPTAAYLLATGLIALVLLDTRGTSHKKDPQ